MTSRRPRFVLTYRIGLAAALFACWGAPRTNGQDGAVGRAGQVGPPQSVSLSTDKSTTASQIANLREALTTAITQAASPGEITRLLQRRRQTDDALVGELDAIRLELAEIERADFDPTSLPRREQLRRNQSLLWLARVELSSLTAELFADGSPDSHASAQRTARMILDALVVFPNEGVVRDELTRLLSESQLRGGSSPTSEVVIDTADELAFAIRIDLANQDWTAAAEKLKPFFGDHPANAGLSPAMDLARLQYLLRRPNEAGETNDMAEIGRWLDAIEQRSGLRARQAAETMLARDREFRGTITPPGAAAASSSAPAIDPRILRADARYYLRVGQPLPAAITFARAAVRDDNADRSIDSALRSAAILDGDSKHLAASQLLQQTAQQHADHESAAMLMLQAASLLAIHRENNPAENIPAENDPIDLLIQVHRQWPGSSAAIAARDTLITAAETRGDLIEAARWASRMPAEHWTSETASRCRDAWIAAILPPAPATIPCRWDDLACHEKKDNAIAHSLRQMHETLKALPDHPLADQTRHACIILLDPATQGPSSNARLVTAEQAIDDPFLKRLAGLRLGRANHSSAPGNRPAADEKVRHAMVWRLHRDLLDDPGLHRPSAAFLLELLSDDDQLAPPTRMQCLVWSGQTDRALSELNRQLASETARVAGDAATRIAAVASALADSARSRDQEYAVDLWQQLADGLPATAPAHARARVNSIVCRWRSGDQTAARTAAELMLLTSPPPEPLRTELNRLLQTP